MRKLLLVLLLMGVLVVGVSAAAAAKDFSIRLQTGPIPSTFGVEAEVDLTRKVSGVVAVHGTYLTTGLRFDVLGSGGPFVTVYGGYNWEESGLWAGATAGYEYVIAKGVSIKGELGGGYSFVSDEFEALFVLGVGYRF